MLLLTTTKQNHIYYMSFQIPKNRIQHIQYFKSQNLFKVFFFTSIKFDFESKHKGAFSSEGLKTNLRYPQNEARKLHWLYLPRLIK